MRSKFKILGLGTAVCVAGAVSARAANVSGSVQASYNRNLTINHDSTQTNIGHSYDYQSGTFTLNNAHLAITGSDSATGFGYGVELDAGADAAINFTLSSGGVAPPPPNPYMLDVQEAYVTKALGSSGLGLKAGKYVTYEGIEVVEGGANPTITRGFIFGLSECVSHTGVELTYMSGMVDAHVGAINGWDLVLDNNSMPSWVAKLGLNFGEPLAVAASAIIGPEQAGNNDDMRMSFDLTGVTKAIPMVDLWFQGNYGMESFDQTQADSSASWMGFTVQPVVHLTDMLGVGLRYEYFSDPDAVRAVLMPDLTMQNISVAPTLWLAGGVTARVEFRMDFASEKVFFDNANVPMPTDSQMQIAADVVASF